MRCVFIIHGGLYDISFSYSGHPVSRRDDRTSINLLGLVYRYTEASLTLSQPRRALEYLLACYSPLNMSAAQTTTSSSLGSGSRGGANDAEFVRAVALFLLKVRISDTLYISDIVRWL